MKKVRLGLLVCLLTLIPMIMYYHLIMNEQNELPLNQLVKEQGVMVLAHGGSPRWNNDVLQASRDLANRYPTVVTFGMADAESIQHAIDALEGLGVKKIIAVPLFVSSHSELYRQTEFVLGIREKPDVGFVEGMERAMKNPVKFIWKKISLENVSYALAMMKNHSSMHCDRQVTHRVPIELRPALDASNLVGEILKERAISLSTTPKNETVLIVAHGPIGDDDDALWLSNMEQLALSVKEYPFYNVCVATIRDDAPDEIKNKAVENMRNLVKKCVVKEGRVIVVPLLLAKGGIEGEIRHILKGLSYVYNEETLLPHLNINRWLVQSVAEPLISTDYLVDEKTGYILSPLPNKVVAH